MFVFVATTEFNLLYLLTFFKFNLNSIQRDIIFHF